MKIIILILNLFLFCQEFLPEFTGVSREFWEGIDGNYLSSLTNHKYYPSHPNFFHVIPNFDPPKDVADSYGQVLQAYFMVCLELGWIGGE